MHLTTFHQASLIIFEHLSQPATYCSRLGDKFTIRVIPQPIGQYNELAEHKLVIEQTAFAIRVAELADPQLGDFLLFNNKQYRISQEPVSDEHGLVWAVVATLDNE